MEWNDIRFFLSVARTGSLSEGGVELRASPQTIGRHIASLETALGAELFVRRPNGYRLTDAGTALLPKAEAAEQAMSALETSATDRIEDTTGTVRLATSENLASFLLIPALQEFRQRHPNLRLELVTGVQTLALPRREADLALRLVYPEGGNLTVRKIGLMAYGVFASRTALHNNPRLANDPFAYPVIAWDESFAHLPAARWLAGRLKTPPALSATSLGCQMRAVEAGLGSAVLPCFMASESPNLICIIKSEDVFSEPLWLVTHADLSGSARVRAVADLIIEVARKKARNLLGTD